MKSYRLLIIGLILVFSQGCFCKHYPFEKLKSEVATTLHKQIIEYKKINGTYPYKKDKKVFGKFLKNMGCRFKSKIESYPSGFWKCNKDIYYISFWYPKGYASKKGDSSGFSRFVISLGEFTDCDYIYSKKQFNNFRDIHCTHAECISKYLH